MTGTLWGLWIWSITATTLCPSFYPAMISGIFIPIFTNSFTEWITSNPLDPWTHLMYVCQTKQKHGWFSTRTDQPLQEYRICFIAVTTHGRHDVSNDRQIRALSNRLFKRSTKKTPKSRIIVLVFEGNPPGLMGPPHKGSVMRKCFLIMTSACITMHCS